MIGRPFKVEWRAEDTVEALKAGYQAERDRERRVRLHSLWLLRSGWRLADVAEVVGADYSSVQRWVAWYRRGGLAEVLAHRRAGKGQPRFLNPVQEAQVSEVVSTGRFGTAAEIRDWIAAEFAVEFKVEGIYTLLQRLKCRPKVPRPIHEKADLEAQADWKKGGSTRH
jgi:transposase